MSDPWYASSGKESSLTGFLHEANMTKHVMNDFRLMIQDLGRALSILTTGGPAYAGF